MQLKAILFDLDGVILDSEKIYSRFWKEASLKLGMPLDDDVVLRLRSCDSSIACMLIENATGIPGSYSEIRTLRKELMKEYLRTHDFELKNGVKDFLASIQNCDIKKVIVTSAIPDEKIPILQKYKIYDCFNQIVSVKDVKKNKPYPDVYIYACEKLNILPSECIAIEDSPNGIKSAFDAGVKAIMVPDLSEPTEDIKKMCDVVPNIRSVLEILRRLEY